MYETIVLLPLLGAIIAGLIALAGARGRHPGGPPALGAEDHAHGPVDESHARAAPPPAGSRPAELVTTVFLFASMLLSWVALVDVGFLHHDSRVALFPWLL